MTNLQLDIRTAAHLLGGEPHGNRVSCPGPGHSKKDRSLSVTFTADGFHTTSFAGDDFRDCRDHVKACLGLSDVRPVAIRPQPVTIVSGGTRARQELIARLWKSCIPIQDTLAERYLDSRELSYDGDAIRYRPSSGKMIALITDALTGEPCGWHETILDEQGRKLKRLMHGRAAGGVVRLYEHKAPFGLAIAEGIETALATDVRPVWACLSSSIMKGMPVVPGVDALTVFADHDKAGIAAANAVGERWHAAGCEVTMTTPAQCGTDFADRRAA